VQVAVSLLFLVGPSRCRRSSVTSSLGLGLRLIFITYRVRLSADRAGVGLIITPPATLFRSIIIVGLTDPCSRLC
jgi:hypothetical protein